MDFNYTTEQLAVRKMVAEFVQREIAPREEEIDRTGQFPYDIYRNFGKLGIIGMPFPREVGGSNADWLSLCLAMEEIGREDSGLPQHLTAQYIVCQQILDLSSEANRKRWIEEYLRPIIRGEACGSIASSEPNRCNQDRAAMKTTARLEGNQWVINGNKIFITAAGLDNNLFTIVLAVIDGPKRQLGAILVPKGTPGFTIGRKQVKLGMRGVDNRELFFDDCRVPEENLLSGTMPKGGDFRNRLILASNAIGLQRFCLDKVLSYSKERISWGQAISKRQFIQGKIVDMEEGVELSTLLRDKAAWLGEKGDFNRKLGSMVKYVCTDYAKKAADSAIEIYGGMGFMEDVGVARRYRDAVGYILIQGGTPLQKWFIAQEIGCEPAV